MIVLNASPLISLGKISGLQLLKKCFEEVIIPNEVYEEIIHKEYNIESVALKKSIDEEWIKIEKVNTHRILKTASIGKGEKEAISLAFKYKCILILDDDNARKFAELLGIEVHGTLYCIYLAYKKEIIKKEQVKDMVKKLIDNGFYISTEVYSEFLDLLKNN